MKQTVAKIKYLVLGALLASIGLWALAVTLPHTFNSGDEIKSAEMNANFQALKAAVDALESKLAAVSAGMRALPSASGKAAYVWVYSSGTADTYYNFNSAGGTITATKTGTGKYSVTIPGFGKAGNVQVTAYGGAGPHCGVLAWGASGSDGRVHVRCFDAAGNLVDSAFTLFALR